MEQHNSINPAEGYFRVRYHNQRVLSYDAYSCLFRLQRLIRENADSLATSIVLEQGKTLDGLFNYRIDTSYALLNVYTDAHGDITRGLQVVEHAASAPSLLLGEKIEGSIPPVTSRKYSYIGLT
jgi:hypothetical protein